MRRTTAAVLLAVTALAAAGCGESDQDEDQAQTSVCDARDDMKQQVDKLKGMNASSFDAATVTGALSAIQSDLAKIRDARGDLSGERRDQVEAANKEFSGQVDTALDQVKSSIGSGDAAATVTAAAQQLASGYEQAFARIDCG
jgi:uncharacterized protein YjbJ (UPF0337 family)